MFRQTIKRADQLKVGDRYFPGYQAVKEADCGFILSIEEANNLFGEKEFIIERQLESEKKWDIISPTKLITILNPEL